MKAAALASLTLCLFVAISTSSLAQKAFIDDEVEERVTEKPSIELRSKVVKMIRYANLTDIPRHQRDATIDFIITNDNKILVLNVETYSEYLRNFVKQRMNYQAVNVKGVKRMSTYSLDVKFMAKS